MRGLGVPTPSVLSGGALGAVYPFIQDSLYSCTHEATSDRDKFGHETDPAVVARLRLGDLSDQSV